jgi:hypothetical protein
MFGGKPARGQPKPPPSPPPPSGAQIWRFPTWGVAELVRQTSKWVTRLGRQNGGGGGKSATFKIT